MFDKLYKISITHWILTSILLSLPSFWFALVKFSGKQFGVVDSSGELTVFGIIISLLLFVIILFLALIKGYKDKISGESNFNNQFVLQKILSCVNSVCNKKAFRFTHFIKENQSNYNGVVDVFNEITQPKKQIADLLEEIRICLSEVLGINRDNIGASILYKYINVTKWDWFHSINIDGGLQIDELVNNARTSVRQIIDGKVDLVFYPDKKDGKKLNCYVEDKKDDINNTTGSILCKKINIEIDDKIFINAILNITTYGKQMCEVTDENAKNTIINLVLPPFEERIKLELSLAFIKNSYGKKQNLVERIRRLAELKSSGLLSEDEFNAEKKQLLNIL